MRAAQLWFQPSVINTYILRVWLVLRVPLGIAVALLIVLFAKREWFVPAAVVSFLGEAVQLWCFAALNKNKEITTRGPYALVRNPMYLGRYFILLGCLLLVDEPPLIGLYTVIYVLYLSFRVRQEEERLQGKFPREFGEYCARVGRFVPRWKPYAGNPILYFNRKLFMKNHGLWNALGLIAFYAAVALSLCLR